MEWSDETSLKLIQLYRENPSLWDPTQKDYKNIKRKLDKWTEIAHDMNTDVVNVKKKMESLLGSFRRERLRQEDSRRSGAGTDQLYKSKWFAFNDMQFLSDKFTPRQTKNTMRSENNDAVIGSVPEESLSSFENSIDAIDKMSLPIDNQSVEIEKAKNTSNQSNDSQRTDTLIPPIGKNSLKRKRTVIGEDADAELRLNEAFNLMKSISEKKPAVDDTCTLFSKYVESKLRAFPIHERAILENEIQNLIFNAEMRQYAVHADRPLHIPESMPQASLTNLETYKSNQNIMIIPPEQSIADTFQSQRYYE